MKQLLCTLVMILTALTTYCQPGSLDKLFGKNGIVADSTLSDINAIIQQPDGKLLTAGAYDAWNIEGALVARFLPDGSVDSSFGKNGFAILDTLLGEAYDLVLQPDNKIMIVASSLDYENKTISFIVRFKPDGTVDSSFGVNGICTIPLFNDENGYTEYTRVALEPDGSIIVSGSGSDIRESSDTRYMLLVHVSKDGMFDYSFSEGTGRVVNSAGVRSNCLAIQKDGKILTGGYNFTGDYTGRNFVICRYNPNGTLDETFDDNGIVVTDGLGKEDVPKSILVQPDGKIVAGGYSADTKYYMSAFRYNPDGSLDKTFNSDGKAFVPFGDRVSKAYAAMLQPDGKIILAGGAYDNNAFQGADYALCRLNSDGSVDSSFGENGRQITVLATSEQASCAVLQRDGKMVLGGSYYDDNRGYNSYLLTRYLGDKTERPLIAKIKRFLHNHGIGWKGEGSNVAYYSVEKSTGTAGFREVTRVNKNSTQDYSYLIPSSNNITSSTEYYRIREVSTTGESTYSNIVAINNAAAISIYPNPVKGILTINNLDITATSKITIADLSGTIWMTTVVRQQSTVKYDVSKLKTGTYVLTVTNGDVSSNVKFVKE